MRNSSLLKWAQAGTSGKSSSSASSASGNSAVNGSAQANSGGGAGANAAAKDGNRSWIHPPDTLQRGHIAYLVKFLGTTEVAQPKGILIVKEAIRKLQFSQQLRKAEGAKTPKVELTVSIDGVAIQEPKSKRILHQYPLHRISYCADDKGEKRFFSFIAKEAERDAHSCFVFVSEKLAELDRYLAREGVQDLLTVDLVGLPALPTSPIGAPGITSSSSDTSNSPSSSGVSYDLLGTSTPDTSVHKLELASLNLSTSLNTSGGGSSTVNAGNGLQSPPPPVPPRAFETPSSLTSSMRTDPPTVGTRLEGLLLDELDTDDDFDPRAFESSVGNGNSPVSVMDSQDLDTDTCNKTAAPRLAPPPKMSRDSRRAHPVNGTHAPTTTDNPFKEDLFGSTPFIPSAAPQTNTVPKMNSPAQSSAVTDPFGMGDFSSGKESQYLENAIGLLDKRILEMKDGFSRGLSFGNDDFSLESLDPLRN
ncbi:hypothetical protein R5R35_014672 [Gryllus longicercus]|uniref:PID domain-containing protein n=1 Tax=Gryllus longicercus TaxID=2509291 RepID=A0AAN9VI74_9ORTH